MTVDESIGDLFYFWADSRQQMPKSMNTHYFSYTVS